MDNNIHTVADTYRLENKIGAGGAGIVYLGEHLRLGKKVVLKADKRTLSAKPEILRREVDALKDLSHTYIPQVYDFIEENGTVYTVMDYIAGESFDKPLKRGDVFSQVQVVEWACQLLEALAYLHSRPPHGILHADIKPSNVMLTPQGDIRLIDFNIALALGEEGAIAVGRSFGYASPEHYGLDYSSGNITQELNSNAVTDISEDKNAYVETILESKSPISSGSSSSNKKTITLNIRSDIYSLGATLYHIMTGERPAQNAIDVKPISIRNYSPAVIDIIKKAMNPDQNLRWQSAEEMLYAFRHLRENDVRTKRYKRNSVLTAVILFFVFAVGTFGVFVGLRQMEQLQNAYVFAEYSGNFLRDGDVLSAVDYSIQALSLYDPPIAEAQKALTDALGVYDLADGYKPHISVGISGEVIKLSVSPKETFAAVMTLGMLTVFEPETGNKTVELPTIDSALADVLFTGDEILIYAGTDGITVYNISDNKIMWVDKPATTISVSADGLTIAAVNRDETFAEVYDIYGNMLYTVPFGDRHLRVAVNDRLADPKDNIFALNDDGTLLGVSFSDGSLEIFNLKNNDENIELFDESDYTHFEGGFNGKYFVFSATNSKESSFAVIDAEELKQTDGFTAPERVGIIADSSGVYMTYKNKHTKYNPETLEETAPDYGNNPAVYKFDYGADSPDIKISKLTSTADKDIFNYDSFYFHKESRISGDGKTVMMFSIHGFRLYDINGEMISEVELEDGIYDQQYRRIDGQSYLDVIWYDGTVRKYSAVDGAIFFEEKTEPPDESLYEEFFTDTLKINSPLHGTPTAYDLKTGKKIRELEKDAYLTYVTQVDDYIVTEYISVTDSLRFGLLLNEKCETLAYLPNLCDVVNGELIFDDHAGNLRKSRIYTINELIGLAR